MMKLLHMGIVGAVLAMSGQVCSATDGTLGPTSEGVVNVRMNIVPAAIPEIQITGVSDIDYGQVIAESRPPTISMEGICVYMPTAATYSVQLLVDVSGLPDSIVDDWPMYIEYVGPTGKSAYASIVATTHTSAYGLRGSSTEVCSSFDLASFQLSPGDLPPIPSEDMGDVSFRVSLLVSPE